jgi:hypothetical protein
VDLDSSGNSHNNCRDKKELEDRTLQEELEGYREYVQRVRYRLIPGIY